MSPYRYPRIGRLSHLFGRKSWGQCIRCRTTGRFVDLHPIALHEGKLVCYALCELCWAELIPSERSVWLWHWWHKVKDNATTKNNGVTYDELRQAAL